MMRYGYGAGLAITDDFIPRMYWISLKSLMGHAYKSEISEVDSESELQ